MKIDRVILSTDEDQKYIEFWPLVSRAWSLLGYKPTLLLVSENAEVDFALGEVIRVPPVEGIPTSTQAQCVRLLGPTLFPDEVSILSDIDMMPLSDEYFSRLIADIPTNNFVVYSSDLYEEGHPCFPMCYVAGKGRIFEEIFDSNMSAWSETIKNWAAQDFGWNTDERILYEKLTSWDKVKLDCTFLDRGKGAVVRGRLDRSMMLANALGPLGGQEILEKKYIDFHMPRPYSKYKGIIDYYFNYFQTSLEYEKLEGYKKPPGCDGLFSIYLNKREGRVFKKAKQGNLISNLLSRVGEINQYKSTLENLESIPIIGKYTMNACDIERDGSYKSRYVIGFNLYNIDDVDGEVLDKIKKSVRGLKDDLNKFASNSMTPEGTLIGDWALHNLIYSTEEQRIYNVDLEGFYTYPRVYNNGNCSISYCNARFNELIGKINARL